MIATPLEETTLPEVTLDSLGADTPAPDLPLGRGKQSSGVPSSVEEKAIALLGTGVSAEQTASALGVSASRISQLLSEEVFADKVTDLRYKSLQSHNTRDASYDSLEDKLLDKLEKALPLMMRPGEILKALQTVNAAKRRGQSAPQQVTASQTVISLVLPTQITQMFSTNTHNQVVSAGGQDLLTMQSSHLLSLTEDESKEEHSNEHKTKACTVLPGAPATSSAPAT